MHVYEFNTDIQYHISTHKQLNERVKYGKYNLWYINKIQSVSKKGPTEIWTRIAGFKVQSANHYTMGPLMNI